MSVMNGNTTIYVQQSMKIKIRTWCIFKPFYLSGFPDSYFVLYH